MTLTLYGHVASHLLSAFFTPFLELSMYLILGFCSNFIQLCYNFLASSRLLHASLWYKEDLTALRKTMKQKDPADGRGFEHTEIDYAKGNKVEDRKISKNLRNELGRSSDPFIVTFEVGPSPDSSKIRNPFFTFRSFSFKN